MTRAPPKNGSLKGRELEPVAPVYKKQRRIAAFSLAKKNVYGLKCAFNTFNGDMKINK